MVNKKQDKVKKQDAKAYTMMVECFLFAVLLATFALLKRHLNNQADLSYAGKRVW